MAQPLKPTSWRRLLAPLGLPARYNGTVTLSHQYVTAILEYFHERCGQLPLKTIQVVRLDGDI
jgi:redox-regulated HSP33 family molecular chaperone